MNKLWVLVVVGGWKWEWKWEWNEKIRVGVGEEGLLRGWEEKGNDRVTKINAKIYKTTPNQ
jgi:hypothetical protein|nr:MAG TPA: hypothetical protein [Caudoviricetes sp.]